MTYFLNACLSLDLYFTVKSPFV